MILLQHVHRIWSNKHPIFDRYAVLISVGKVWPYAALSTVGGAYENWPLNAQLSCRVDSWTQDPIGTHIRDQFTRKEAWLFV